MLSYLLTYLPACLLERVHLTNTQLKSAEKSKKEGTLRLHKKNFEDEELSHELFVTTRQSIKICNVIAKNTSTDIKISKDQILKWWVIKKQE